MLDDAVAAIGPCPVTVAGVIVTVELLRLTTPVKSCIRSSWPEARLELARGRVKALRTLLLLKFKARLVPEMDKAVAKFRSMPIPVTALWVTVKERFATGLLEAAKLKGQMVLAGQLESVAPVSFKKVILALPVRTNVTLVYWTAGMFAKVPRKAESVCRRIRSTVRAGLRLTVVDELPEEVNLREVMVT